MKNIYKSWSLLLVGIVLFLAACGDSSSSTSETKEKEGTSTEKVEKVTIGVTQIVEHPSLNAAYEGFQKAIEDAGIRSRI